MRGTQQNPLTFGQILTPALTPFIRWRENLDRGDQLTLASISNLNGHVRYSLWNHCRQMQWDSHSSTLGLAGSVGDRLHNADIRVNAGG
ncbi:MAG: hypothetical protein ETSY2_02805 [Candidatus Entotheonella gemina]|uniref:Uncharacterized protein n=1 Tax=Candidatus Entotheonella gemina TaxID=1429439 RepID=W4MFD5_9BACT|nr:MAG: hypothetical protein ETSY2_02805 [Candidatus Entotheonella gemina]